MLKDLQKTESSLSYLTGQRKVNNKAGKTSKEKLKECLNEVFFDSIRI